jgi:hydrogenase expression/formation protein HypC
MCLAIPGKILEIVKEGRTDRKGRVSFGGVVKEVNLSFTPQAGPGDYVLVHVGFALSKVDEAEAEKTLEILGEMDELGLGSDPKP